MPEMSLNAVTRVLRDRYPAVAQHLPLAKNTRQRLEEDSPALGISIHLLQKALRAHTRTNGYLFNTARDRSRRYHLDGTEEGPVSDADRTYAATTIKARLGAQDRKPEPNPIKRKPPKLRAGAKLPEKVTDVGYLPAPAPVVTAAALGRPRLSLRARG